MLDEIKRIDKDWLLDKTRLGERHLKDCIDEKAHRTPKKRGNKDKKKNRKEEADASPYDDLSVPKEKPHSLDENV